MSCAISRETEIEVNRWHVVVDEAERIGIDLENDRFRPFVRAVQNWGESLVRLRMTQTTEVIAQASSVAETAYAATKIPK